MTIDNASPANVFWSGVTAGATIALNWAARGRRRRAERELGPVEDVPAEGATYASNTTYGTSQVAFAAGTLPATPGRRHGGRPYYYRVFTEDSCNNYSTGSSLGPVYAGGSRRGRHHPNSPKPVVGIVSTPANGPVTRPFKVQVRVFSPGTRRSPRSGCTGTTERDGASSSARASARARS